MRIHRRAQTPVLVSFIGAPALAVADEETLLGGEFIQGLQVLSLGVFLPRHVSQNQSAQIGDILAQCEFSVDLDVVNDRVVLQRSFLRSLPHCRAMGDDGEAT